MRGIDQGRPFPISMLEREQPGLAPDRMQIESSSTPPAKDSTCERGSGQGRVGSKASGACRLLSFPPPDPVPLRKCTRGPGANQAAPSGAHRQMRGTERVHSPAPLIGRRRIAVGDRQSNRPNRFLVPDWTTRRTRKKAGTVPGSRPVGRLRIRRACRRGPCGPPALRDVLARCCSHLRRGQITRVHHPR